VPEPQEYQDTIEPHARGGILVAAVFDAFLSIYQRRTADLVRLATGGTGVLQPGAIHPDLANRLAQEAAKSAQHVLTMCVRAIDYCPPVDITFGEFLRAVITADFDLVKDDDLNYRIAFVQAFRKRGIYPLDMRTLSVGSLLWRGPENDELRPSADLQNGLATLRDYSDQNLYTRSREKNFELEREYRRDIHQWLKQWFTAPRGRKDAEYLGLEPAPHGRAWKFEVRSARIAYRSKPDGGMVPQLLLTLLQPKDVPGDAIDPNAPKISFEGGSTIIADLRSCQIQYCVRKSISSGERLARQQKFALESSGLRSTYFGASGLNSAEPFAATHRGV